MSSLTLSPNPAPDYHWTGPNQRRFLETLADTGVVSLAAKAVEMSAEAAYSLRRKADGASFALGWAAALLVARDRLVDDLMERALLGQEDVYIREPEDNRMRRQRKDNRLGMGMLARLDRMVAEAECFGTHNHMARIVAGDFERFLDLVEREGGGAEAGLFLATHSDAQNSAFHYQLPQNIAPLVDHEEEEVAEPEAPIDDPERDASFLTVWWEDSIEEWRTDFPPPDGFDGEEEGRYGEDDYVRTLSDDEKVIFEAQQAVENRPYREAAERARDAWFAVDVEVQAELERQAANTRAEIAAREAKADAKRCEREEARTQVLPREEFMPQAAPSGLAEVEEIKSAKGCGDEKCVPGDEPVFTEHHPSTFRPVRMRPQPVYGQGGGVPPWAQRIG
jgi:hypothetical protein